MKVILKILDIIEEGVMLTGLAVMVVMNFVNVVCRFLLPQTPFSYTEELTILLFEWVTMFGIAYGYKKTAHTGLSLITDRLNISGKRVMLIFSTVCTLLLMIIVIWSGSMTVKNQLSHGNVFPGLKISSAWGGMAIPAGGVMIAIRALQVCFEKMKTLRRGGEHI